MRLSLTDGRCVVRPGAVARADRPLAHAGIGPLDAERRVVPAYACGRFGDERGRDQVEDVGVRDERLESVSAAFRHVERLPVSLVEANAVPAEVRRRTEPQVEDDVEDRAADTPHELRLLVRGSLEMHAAESSRPGRAGDARLGEIRRQAGGGELVRVPDPGEEPALVLVALELDDDCAGNRGLVEPHGLRARTVAPPEPFLQLAVVQQVSELAQADVAAPLEELGRERIVR